MAFSSNAPISSNNNRIIALVDMDCFYVQVEQRRNPELKGRPCVVVQYKKWRGGGIIAVGYEARKFGVTRQMRGDDAKEKCPDVNLIYVQENRGKADLTVYREAGAEVIRVLSTFSDALERASIDEAYIDLTETIKRYRTKYTIDEIASKLLQSTHVINIPAPDTNDGEKVLHSEAFELVCQRLRLDSNLNLAIGTIVASEMRDAVHEKTGFTCSAGIAHNKMLAKLVGGMHKPNQQTVIFTEDVPELYEQVKLKKVRHLGGKLGNLLKETFSIETMKELATLSLSQLKERFGDKTGHWIYSLGKGIDNEPIRIRQLPKSVGCCKNFRGPDKLDKISKVSYWLDQLASEICERLDHELEVNNRVATHMSVSFSNVDKTSCARSCKIGRIDAEQIKLDALRVLHEFNNGTLPDQWDPPVVYLGLSTCKFEESNTSCSKSIKDFFVDSASKSKQFQGSRNLLKNAQGKNDATRLATFSSSSSSKANVNRETKKTVGLERFFLHDHKNAELGEAPLQYQCDSNKSENAATIASEVNNEPSGKVSDALHANVIENNLNEPNNGCVPESKQRGNPAKYFDNCDISTKENSDITGLPVAAKSNLMKESYTEPDMLATSRPKEVPFPRPHTPDDFAVCCKCGQHILQWELPEHNDFHFAQDLQNQLRKESNTAIPASSSIKTNNSPPRKKVKPNTIYSFFKTK